MPSPTMIHNPSDRAREKAVRLGLIEEIFESLDLTETQLVQARRSYETVADWIAGSTDPLLKDTTISPQGSIALRTITRPISGNEFDVDLISIAPYLTPETPPAVVKRAFGNRLREHELYARMLVEKGRCWRLEYAGLFHLDKTPAIPNPACPNGGLLVPDKALKVWKPTNPSGYQARFEYYASLSPNIPMMKSYTEARGATVEPFPERKGKKKLLPLIVQMQKRQRDIYFSTRDASLAPISVILTTLTGWSYAKLALSKTPYGSELDFVIDVVRHLPDFIQVEYRDGKTHYLIPNETTDGENFAEKWNVDPRLPLAFSEWHGSLMELLGEFDEARGIDQVQKSLTVAFGESAVAPTFKRRVANVSNARASHMLSVAPSIGLTTSNAGVQVQQNRFFGKAR